MESKIRIEKVEDKTTKNKKTISKKANFILSIVIGITCCILTMAMSMQFKLVSNVQSSDIETMRKAELTTELADLKEKNKDLDKRYAEIEELLEQYKQTNQSDSDTKKVLEEELEKLKLNLGLTNVEGPGLRIKIDDSSSTNKMTENRFILLVNNLKSAGAEAISINGNRIVAITDIVYIDDNTGYLKINQNIVLNPFEIEVIGNADVIQNTITQVGGEIYNLRQLDINIQIEKQNKITIGKYDRNYDSVYLKKEG